MSTEDARSIEIVCPISGEVALRVDPSVAPPTDSSPDGRSGTTGPCPHCGQRHRWSIADGTVEVWSVRVDEPSTNSGDA